MSAGRSRLFGVFIGAAVASRGAIVVLDKPSGVMIGLLCGERFEPAAGGSVEIGWSLHARSYANGASSG